MKHRFKAARLLPEQLADGLGFVTNFNESAFLSAVHSGAREARPESIVKRVMPTGGFRACAQGGASPGSHFRLIALMVPAIPRLAMQMVLAPRANVEQTNRNRPLGKSRDIGGSYASISKQYLSQRMTQSTTSARRTCRLSAAQCSPSGSIKKRKFENVEVTYRPRACERPRCWIFVDCNRTGERG